MTGSTTPKPTLDELLAEWRALPKYQRELAVFAVSRGIGVCGRDAQSARDLGLPALSARYDDNGAALLTAFELLRAAGEPPTEGSR